MCAILEDAMHVYVRECGSSRQSRAFQEARKWIHSNDRKWVFSFLRICEALDLDAFGIRRRLQSRPHPVRSGQVRAA